MIELIAVILIVAILSGVAITSFDSIADREIRFAASQTADLLTYVRERAIATGRATWATFDPAADTLELREDDAADPGFANCMPLVDPVNGQDSLIDIPLRFGAAADLTAVDFENGSTIGFDWMGRPTLSTGNAMSDDSGEVAFNSSVFVRVYADSGFARVE